MWPFRLVVCRHLGWLPYSPFRLAALPFRLVHNPYSEGINEGEEIKAGKSDEEFLRRGSCKEIKDCKQIKDCEELRNCCSCEEIKKCKAAKNCWRPSRIDQGWQKRWRIFVKRFLRRDQRWQRDQGLRRGKESMFLRRDQALQRGQRNQRSRRAQGYQKRWRILAKRFWRRDQWLQRDQGFQRGKEFLFLRRDQGLQRD